MVNYIVRRIKKGKSCTENKKTKKKIFFHIRCNFSATTLRLMDKRTTQKSIEKKYFKKNAKVCNKSKGLSV